jgi:hypothetical protein
LSFKKPRPTDSNFCLAGGIPPSWSRTKFLRSVIVCLNVQCTREKNRVSRIRAFS